MEQHFDGKHRDRRCDTGIVSGFIWNGKRHIPEQTAEKPKKGRLSEERREKQTRLFNILESQTELEMPTERENERKQYLSACDIAEKDDPGIDRRDI